MMKTTYFLVIVLFCLCLAHGSVSVRPSFFTSSSDANRLATDPPSSLASNLKHAATTLDPFIDSQSSNSDTESKSQRGFRVSKNVFKFIATVRENPSDLYLCSATFIRKDVLITTARCVFGRNPAKLSVHSNSSGLQVEGPGNIGVKSLFIHPDFEMSPVTMDFSIITLKEAVDYITPVSLPVGKIGRPGSIGTVYTWRFTPDTVKFVIHEHRSKIISNSKCFLLEQELIPDGMVCAEGLPYQEGQFDTGMPFIIKRKGQNYVFGLSYISGRQVTAKVDKVWKIDEILPWITDTLQDDIKKNRSSILRAAADTRYDDFDIEKRMGGDEEEEKDMREDYNMSEWSYS